MGLELRQVELNQLVVLGTLVLVEFLAVGTGEVGDVLTLCSAQVVVHAVVVGEERSSGTNLSTHVTNRTHPSARKRVDTRTMVLDDSTSTTLDGKKTSDLKDNVCIARTSA